MNRKSLVFDFKKNQNIYILRILFFSTHTQKLCFEKNSKIKLSHPKIENI